MNPIVLWVLRGILIFDVLGLLMVLGRVLRAMRAAQFKVRPSTAQGLAGLFTPSVTLVVTAPGGRVGRWVSAVRYPRLDVVVAVPRGVADVRAPRGARVARARTSLRGDLIAAALQRARGEVVVIVPGDLACGPGFVSRLVAPLVDPFIGATVGRVVVGGPGGLAGHVEDLDRRARNLMQVGRHTIGAPVLSDGDPFAIRAELIDDLGGWDPGHATPDTDLLIRGYTRGFAISYVEEAVALAPQGTWDDLSRRMQLRTAGRRRLWRQLRRPLYRRKVLEGPEKTDVRWALRGASAPLWLAAGWVLTGLLRLVDTSWAPEALGGILLVMTFVTPIWFVPFIGVSAAADLSGRRRLLALVPWLPVFALWAVWSGTGAALLGPFRRRRAVPEQVRAPMEVEVVEREVPPVPRPPRRRRRTAPASRRARRPARRRRAPATRPTTPEILAAEPEPIPEAAEPITEEFVAAVEADVEAEAAPLEAAPLEVEPLEARPKRPVRRRRRVLRKRVKTPAAPREAGPPEGDVEMLPLDEVLWDETDQEPVEELEDEVVQPEAEAEPVSWPVEPEAEEPQQVWSIEPEIEAPAPEEPEPVWAEEAEGPALEEPEPVWAEEPEEPVSHEPLWAEEPEIEEPLEEQAPEEPAWPPVTEDAEPEVEIASPPPRRPAEGRRRAARRREKAPEASPWEMHPGAHLGDRR